MLPGPALYQAVLGPWKVTGCWVAGPGLQEPRLELGQDHGLPNAAFPVPLTIPKSWVSEESVQTPEV